jgi:hypothetical protein
MIVRVSSRFRTTPALPTTAVRPALRSMALRSSVERSSLREISRFSVCTRRLPAMARALWISVLVLA